MIFDGPQARLIRRGKATRHHWPRKSGETTCRVKPQRSYSIQTSANRTADGYIVVLSVEHRLAGDFTFAEAVEMGYRTRDDAKAALVQRWDKRWLLAQEEVIPAVAAQRFDERFAEVAVWAMRFKLQTDRPRFLSASLTRGDYAYSEYDALPDEPEVMDPDLLHTDWAQRASAHHRAALASVDAARLSGLTHPEEWRLEMVRMARELGIDVRSDVRLVEKTEAAARRARASLERKVKREAA